LTLIVSLASPDVAVLIADRRLSRNGAVLNDEYNKVTVLFCADARMAVAFTGVATLPNFDASTWIAETLHSVAGQATGVHEVLENFRQRLAERFRTLSSPNLRLTVVFCGFVYWGAAPEPRIYVVSNFETGNHEQSTFSTRIVGAPGARILELAGATAAISEKTRLRLLALLDAEVPSAALVRFAVKHIQNSASDSRSLGSIGEQCNAAVVRSIVDTPVTTTYHTARNANRAYGPNVVIAGSLISLGSEVMAPGILAGPDIRKRDPCWCGSGLTFKHCHLQKYGAVYLKHPAWNRPLVSMIQTRREESSPAGKVFCVQSGYV